VSLATVCQSLNSLPMDNYRRMAFSEEVVAYLDAAVINSHVILAYLCVWAGERLGGDGRAGAIAAAPDAEPTQNAPSNILSKTVWPSGRINSHRHTGHDKTVAPVAHRRGKHDTDTVRQDSFVGSSPAV